MSQRTSWSCAMVVAALVAFSVNAFGQTSPSVSPPDPQPTPTATPSPVPSLEKNFFVNILSDQRAIWTSPFRAGRGDVKWLAPLGLSTAILFATDRHTSGELVEDHNQTRINVSNVVSRLGDFPATGGVAAAFYFIGRAKKNARARETGLLGAEALIDSAIVVEGLKTVSQRPRPLVDHASGEFFDRGTSFPSGHAISAWSLAAVIDSEYGQHRPLVRVGVYGVATAVSLSRFTGDKHFLSDVLVGSALGYGIGRYVYHRRHDYSLDSVDGDITKGAKRSRLLPLIAPRYNRRARAYGATLAWTL
jgi:membrane-associated phospholipid phosphatase